VSYGYDSGTNGKGHRTSMTDGSGSTTWSYDDRGRLIEEIKVISGTGGGSFKTQWSYNSADLVSTMKYPSNASGGLGETVTYTYLSRCWWTVSQTQAPTPTYRARPTTPPAG
jgi:YD repeat-containing protein